MRRSRRRPQTPARTKPHAAAARPTQWEGETIARFAFLHPETTPAMVEEILATME